MTNKFLIPWKIFAALLILTLGLGACSPGASQAPAEPVKLRLTLLPILESLPMYVAEAEGLFDAQQIQVEFIPVASAQERDQLITAGQADGMINEAVSTMFYNQDQTQVQIVRYARTATAQTPLFSILAAGSSDIQTTQDLKGVPIGISEGTIIHYLTDRLLQAEGFSPQEIQTIAVPKIPDRLALLSAGELQAGMLPEPVTSLAVLQGARVILDDSSYPQYSFSTISFRKVFLDEHPQAVRAFLAALEEAVVKINANPSQYKPLLAEKQLVPPPLMESFAVPTMATAGIPTQAQWDDAMAWVKEKGLLAEDVSYSESVTDQYLP